jgi:prefoldin subunit 5
MVKLKNNIIIDLGKGYYNKAELSSKDNVYKANTKIDYPMYVLKIQKDYFDVESKKEVVEEVIKDLEETLQELKNLRDNEKER